MDQRQRRDSGMLYITTDAVFEEQKRARRLTQKLNTMDRSDFDGLRAVVAELLGRETDAFINPPFYCDYGDHIIVGKNVFINYNCTILDVGLVRIGDNCFMAPNVSIYTAGHPVHPAARNTLYEYGLDVTIGENCWIGGNVVIGPGVTIGANSVIGAGSIVTKDVPPWSVAAGNPCRVLRAVTEADRYLWYRGREADPEAKADMERVWREASDPEKYPAAPDSRSAD